MCYNVEKNNAEFRSLQNFILLRLRYFHPWWFFPNWACIQMTTCSTFFCEIHHHCFVESLDFPLTKKFEAFSKNHKALLIQWNRMWNRESKSILFIRISNIYEGAWVIFVSLSHPNVQSISNLVSLSLLCPVSLLVSEQQGHTGL